MKNIRRPGTIVLVVAMAASLLYLFIQSGKREMVLVEAGTLITREPYTDARKEVRIGSFYIDRNLVTVAEYEAFTETTGYVTEAESFGNAGVFDLETKAWALVDSADYHYPFGRNKPKAAPDHPVTQVSWNDATAYARWKGKRLPTQWEWEYAAKNGEPSSSENYTWGSSLVENGTYKANTWQGTFPSYNTVEDGYAYTSPVGVFGANKIGLTDMGGNVWQWCEDSIAPTPQEAELDTAMRRVTRGGSFLCDPMVCHGYQVTGRSSSTPESSLAHIGFRCVKDVK